VTLWLFQYCIRHKLSCWDFTSILVSLTNIASIYISPYFFHYSWPPVVPSDQLCCLLFSSMPSYWGIVVQSYYFPSCQSSQLLSQNKANCSFISIWQGELNRVPIRFFYTTYTTTTWSVHYLSTLIMWLVMWHYTIWPCDILSCERDLWHLWCDIFPHSFLCSKSKRKVK